MAMMQQAGARTPEREALYDENGDFDETLLRERLHGSVTARPTTRHWNFQRYVKTFGLIIMVGVSSNLAMPIGRAQARGDSVCRATTSSYMPWISPRPQC